ncbi:MAG: glycoside hydrolase family 57 protein [Bacteroidales bacterium]
MRSICFYFQVHQPFRLRTYRFFDIGNNHDYFDDFQNRYIARRVADKCYIPTNQLLLELIQEYGSRFKISYSISGTALDQFEKYTPDVIESFQRLAATGCVEFLSETYTHSLAALKSKDEFQTQVIAHREKIQKLFGVTPKTFRNTELIYSDGIGEMVAEMGFETMLTEGAKHILGWKSPNFMYCNAINPKLKLLLKNFQLSDDIAFRFSQQSWEGWPLTSEKFVDWINQLDQKQEVINLFMDYETFGEHQWQETGIFEFMRALPARVFSHSNFTFNTPSEVSAALQPISAIYVPHPISWADEERDLTAWLGNDLQDEAFDAVYAIEHKVKAINNFQLIMEWRYLQTSDHFYYMCTKWFSDGDVHKYFNPYGTPYEAFINYMNVLSDFIIRIDHAYDTIPLKSLIEGKTNHKGTTVVTKEKPLTKKKTVAPSKVKKVLASDINAKTSLKDAKIKKVVKKA